MEEKLKQAVTSVCFSFSIFTILLLCVSSLKEANKKVGSLNFLAVSQGLCRIVG